MKLKRIICLLIAFCLLCPLYALADDSGVLAESELNEWVVKALRDSAAERPLNAPVGEESHTEDGYAFIYDFATLYYDKPELDENSVLLAVSVTNEAYPGPRGIKLGDAQSVLIDTYGWQNPTLVGDGIFAAFYRLNSLPQSAYWSWAQLDGADGITSVQCAIHVQVADGRYTDAGVAYSLEGGVVTAIRIYGLSSFVGADEVRGNLEAVGNVQTAASGDAVDAPDITLSAATVAANQAQPFGAEDLSFAGIDYASLTLESAKSALGEPASQSAAEDAAGGTYLNLTWSGAELIWLEDETAGRAQSLRVTDAQIEGPRGLKAGMPFEEAAALFLSEGKPGVLYGQSGDTEYGEAVNEGTQTLLTYYMAAGAAVGDGSYVLQLVFENGALKEWVLSTSEVRWTM